MVVTTMYVKMTMNTMVECIKGESWVRIWEGSPSTRTLSSPHSAQRTILYIKNIVFLSQYSWEIMQNSAKRAPYCCLTYPVCNTINNTDYAKQSTHKIHIIAILKRKKSLAAEVLFCTNCTHVRYCKVHWSGPTFGSEPGIEIILADLSSQPETSN